MERAPEAGEHRGLVGPLVGLGDPVALDVVVLAVEAGPDDRGIVAVAGEEGGSFGDRLGADVRGGEEMCSSLRPRRAQTTSQWKYRAITASGIVGRRPSISYDVRNRSGHAARWK